MNTQQPVLTVDLEKFLARVAALVETVGYVSNSDVKGTGRKSTAMLAFEWVRDNQRPAEVKDLPLTPDQIAAFRAKGKEVADWMAGIELDKKNEYMMNLLGIGQAKCVNEKFMGYAASAIAAYEKEKNKISVAQTSLDDLQKLYGPVGAKVGPILVEYISRSQFDSRFGLCYKYQFADKQGNKIAWMTGTDFPNLTMNSAYRIEGTIKEYSSFKGTHELLITRAKIK